MKIKVGAVCCIWCGETVWHATVRQHAEARRAMMRHDMDCPKHPAVREREVLRREVRSLTARLNYYVNTLTLGALGPLTTVHDGGPAPAINAERAGLVLEERDRLRELVRELRELLGPPETRPEGEW